MPRQQIVYVLREHALESTDIHLATYVGLVLTGCFIQGSRRTPSATCLLTTKNLLSMPLASTLSNTLALYTLMVNVKTCVKCYFQPG